MKVLYDDEIFFRQRFGGVSRVFATLIEGVAHHPNHEVLFTCGYSENEYLLNLYPNTPSFLRTYQFPLKGKLIRGIYGRYAHSKLNKQLASGKADVFHPTFYADYYLNSLGKTPLVFTVHDLIHEKTKGNAHYREMAAIKAKNIARAKEIIVVSTHTKKDLLELYPSVKEEHVHVIPLAQSLPSEATKPNGLPDEYMLFTGERSGYKNFKSLLQAFAKISSSFPNLYLFCAGSSPFHADELALANSLNVGDRIKQSRLSETELRYAYTHAAAFIYPSTYEGFGIPLLEAFDSGTPVIANNATSLPEVTGDAALLVNALSIDELSSSIQQLLTDTTLRDNLIHKGKNRAAEFSWEKHISQTISVYEKALQ